MTPNQNLYLKTFTVLFALVSLLILAGCVAPTATPFIALPTVATASATNTLAVDRPTPTAFAISPTSTVAPPSSTATSDIACHPQETSLPPGFLAPGEIIFENREYTNLYGMTSQEQELRPFLPDLTGGNIYAYPVSPDGRWLILFHEQWDDQGSPQHTLVVTTSDTDGKITIPWETKTWANILGWLADSQRLAIMPLSPNGDANSISRADDLIVFNPFTGQQQRIVHSFSYSANLPTYMGGISAIYDPTLGRVAYFDDETTLILWDNQQLRELWRYVEPSIMAAEKPVWTADGHTLALVGLIGSNNGIPNEQNGFEFLFISPDGKIARSDPFPYYLGLDHSLGWSPDGRYLYFYWAASKQADARLLLWDTKMRKVLDYCLAGASQPVWSPDSRQFISAVETKTEISSTEKVYSNLIVDVEQDRIIQLGDVAFLPVAWINTVP